MTSWMRHIRIWVKKSFSIKNEVGRGKQLSHTRMNSSPPASTIAFRPAHLNLATSLQRMTKLDLLLAAVHGSLLLCLRVPRSLGAPKKCSNTFNDGRTPSSPVRQG